MAVGKMNRVYKVNNNNVLKEMKPLKGYKEETGTIEHILRASVLLTRF